VIFGIIFPFFIREPVPKFAWLPSARWCGRAAASRAEQVADHADGGPGDLGGSV
jgi:hypothetical protein